MTDEKLQEAIADLIYEIFEDHNGADCELCEQVIAPALMELIRERDKLVEAEETAIFNRGMDGLMPPGSVLERESWSEQAWSARLPNKETSCHTTAGAALDELQKIWKASFPYMPKQD